MTAPYVPVICHAAVHAEDVEALHAADCAEHRNEHSAKHHAVPLADQAALTMGPLRKMGAESSIDPSRSGIVLLSQKQPLLQGRHKLLFLLDLPHLHFSQHVLTAHFATAPPA